MRRLVPRKHAKYTCRWRSFRHWKAFARSYLLSPNNHVIAAELAFGNFLSSVLKDDYQGEVCGNAKGELSLVYPFGLSRQRGCYGLAILVEDLDFIVHSAGVRGLEPDIPISKSSDVAKAKTKDVTTVETLQHTFHVNAIGAFLLLEAMMPQLCHDGHPKVIIKARELVQSAIIQLVARLHVESCD